MAYVYLFVFSLNYLGFKSHMISRVRLSTLERARIASPSAINGTAPKKKVTTPNIIVKSTGAPGLAVSAIVNIEMPKMKKQKNMRNRVRPARIREKLIRPFTKKS